MNVMAQYLVAADGANSPTHTQLLIPTTGRGTMGHALFHAYLISLVHLSYDPSKEADFRPEKCKELLRLASPPQLQSSRIFLAGDAAHRMPPWAGQGANSGIADVHDLAWKSAAVIKGDASEKLLESYDVERLPVGRAAAEASARGAICPEDISPLGGWSWRPWTMPSLFLSIDRSPGSRAPHLWVELQGKCISTLDLSGKSFVLLAGANGASWVDATTKVSSTMGIDIAAYHLGPEGDLLAPKSVFESAAGISSQGAILVRPDDFIVWRQRRQSSDCRAELDQAMKQALYLQ
ncbi:hypothetical protein B7494_g4626 [Chlorociboria aeruginascens]|nr:hypothetical protein B7494_g4626 [Chlorociboria aeruginascens]